jgi:hypothetical protein
MVSMGTSTFRQAANDQFEEVQAGLNIDLRLTPAAFAQLLQSAQSLVQAVRLNADSVIPFQAASKRSRSFARFSSEAFGTSAGLWALTFTR